MSMTLIDQRSLLPVQRQVWGSCSAVYREGPREEGAFGGGSAHLAGMEPSEWLAVEAGRVPETAAQLTLDGRAPSSSARRR